MKFATILLVLVSIILQITPVTAQTDIQFEERMLRHDGQMRRYLLYVPATYDSTESVPLYQSCVNESVKAVRKLVENISNPIPCDERSKSLFVGA